MNDNDLFSELKQIRIEKNISLEQLCEESRIQMKYLHALEAGELLKIPEVYDKLFFRAYLQALGLGEEYFDRFMELRRKVRVDKTTTVINFISPKELDKKFNLGRNILVIIPLVVVILLIWIMVQNTQMISMGSQEPVEEITIQSIVNELENSTKADSDTVISDSTIFRQLNLDITGLKRTWFRVVVDRDDTLEYLLQSGSHMSLIAKNTFEFLIGRADGLIFRMNGQELEKPGNDSTVVRYLRIDSTGVTAKLLKE
jgi:cytoskeletal protein RodZ